NCLNNIEIPSGMQIKKYNVFGKPVDEAYNHEAMVAIQDEADFMLTVEDDTFPPPDAFIRLWNLYKESKAKTIVGAWYPKRQESKEGTPIVIKNGKREALAADGKI